MQSEIHDAVQAQVATALLAAQKLLAPWATQAAEARHMRVAGNGRADSLTLTIQPDQLLAAVQALIDAGWGYLITITGLDLGPEAGDIEVLYHFAAGAAVVTLCVKVGRETAVVPSVCPIIPSASFFERELSEMLGITVQNTPNTDRLFLPDNWPDGVYPLRKEFKTEGPQPGDS